MRPYTAPTQNTWRSPLSLRTHHVEYICRHGHTIPKTYLRKVHTFASSSMGSKGGLYHRVHGLACGPPLLDPGILGPVNHPVLGLGYTDILELGLGLGLGLG